MINSFSKYLKNKFTHTHMTNMYIELCREGKRGLRPVANVRGRQKVYQNGLIIQHIKCLKISI